MTQPTGQEANAAVFAAQGAARPRLVRAAVAAGIALVAAWLVALVLGVFAGFDALPRLHDSSSRASTETTSPAHHASPIVQRVVHRSSPAPQPKEPAPASTVSAGRGATLAKPKASGSVPTVTQAPSTAAATTGSAHTQGTAPTTTGKPVGSPGNGPGGAGAPGQLR